MSGHSGYEIDTSRVEMVGEALAHRLRIRTLLQIRRAGKASPTQVSKALGESLGVVSYHANVLLEKGAIVEVEKRPKRGTIEHFFALSEFGEELLYAASILGRTKRLAEYDAAADTARFSVATGEFFRSDERDWGLIEKNAKGEAIGVEVHRASSVFPGDLLDAMPPAPTAD